MYPKAFPSTEWKKVIFVFDNPLQGWHFLSAPPQTPLPLELNITYI